MDYYTGKVWRMDIIKYLLILGVLEEAVRGRVEDNMVQIDLGKAKVRGYSPYVSFIQSPTASRPGVCSSQAVVKVDFSGAYQGAKVLLHYGQSPHLWTVDISDSKTGDGYGNDAGTTSNMAEVHIHNKQLRIYGNVLPGYMDASSDGGLLIKTIDSFARKGSKAVLDISDERIEWRRGKMRDYLDSKFLFTLNGQETLYGDVDHDVYLGFNRVVAGNYRNGSGLCSVTIQLYTTRGKECEQGLLKCHADADCIDTRRTPRCKCKPGFLGNGTSCVDINECNRKNGGCVHFCHNVPGNYTCSCREGFQLSIDGRTCIDKNECFEHKGGCQHQCINTIGGFECKCNQGYSLGADGIACNLGTWCQKRQGCAHFCQTNPLQGTVECVCRAGYRLHPNGKDCVQSCAVGNGGCQHNCSDSDSGPVCSCYSTDYLLTADNMTCIATCKVRNGGCQRKCNDTAKGPVCSCPEGYKLHQDQKSCLDVNECAENNGNCSHKCDNLEGSYECVCPPGFKVQQTGLDTDFKQCQDIDECQLSTSCDHICINKPGSYKCACREGYDLYGITHCADRDECSHNNGGCQFGCDNSMGSYTCLCDAGYKLHPNKKDCIEASRCYELQTPPGAEMLCDTKGEDTVCVLKCQGNGQFTTLTDQSVLTTQCGPGTQYQWDQGVGEAGLPSCSSNILSPDLLKRVKFRFVSQRCRLRRSLRVQLTKNITDTINAQKKYKCKSHCQIPEPVELKCDRRRPSGRQKQPVPKLYDIVVDFRLLRAAPTRKDGKGKKNCDIKCERKKTENRLKKTLKIIKKTINKGQFSFGYDGTIHLATKKSLKSPRGTELSCSVNWMLRGDTCVGCAMGSYYNKAQKTCSLCPPGFYQNEEIQDRCKRCPKNDKGVGIYGAQSREECTILCKPGFFSMNGRTPCKPCPVGSFQPDHGRLSCTPCPGRLTTLKAGSVDFRHCQATEVCNPGYYYDINRQVCIPCARGWYQPDSGQNFCIRCPGVTTTDVQASTNRTACKSRECGQVFNHTLQGVLESPNYPGDYPANVSCVWKIYPGDKRRILVIIPDVVLPDDKCGDTLVMRSSRSPYSKLTYETCEKGDRPSAFTARSKKLWVQFKSDMQNTAKGFSIPFVTYNAEYHALIQDIVGDGRLYSSYQHQSVFKDRKLLNALVELVAEPMKYFKYANISSTMMPESFIELIKIKVVNFFRS